MIVIKIDENKLKKVTNATDAYKAMGLGQGEKYEFTDKKVFGDVATYANLFMNDDMYNQITYYIMENYRHKGTCPYTFEWAMVSPISTGKRYDELCKELGVNEVPADELIILEPTDKMYHKDERTRL